MQESGSVGRDTVDGMNNSNWVDQKPRLVSDFLAARQNIKHQMLVLDTPMGIWTGHEYATWLHGLSREGFHKLTDLQHGFMIVRCTDHRRDVSFYSDAETNYPT